MITYLTLPLTPEVVWQQPQETHVNDIHETLTTETHKKTHMTDSRQRKDVESQTSPMKETSSQVPGTNTEPHPGNQTGSTPVQSLNNSKKPQSEIQLHEMRIIANDNGDDKISLSKITNSQTEEQLVRDANINELYMPLSSTIVLKIKTKMLYVPLDFKNV